jgi:hypothetical protein
VLGVQDAIAGFLTAPAWAQIGMVLFAVMAVAMLFGPPIKHRRFRRQYDAIVQGLGHPPPSTRGWPVTTVINIDGRDFVVEHDYRVSRTGAYRGPAGYLLVTSTQLAGSRWSMHQADIIEIGKHSWLRARSKQPTGDAVFDARFQLVEEGLPAREGWLDAATRAAVTRFLDEAPQPGPIWIREGKLLFTMRDPWTGVDGAAMQKLLKDLAALALALNRTASPHR